MMLTSDMEWLVGVSRSLGSCIDLVQGTGGNISVKLDEKRMAIKSSGVRLEEVSNNHGYTTVDFPGISRLYALDVPEQEADNFIKNSVIEGGRPSIETGFHSYLGRYVIHLHPLDFNILLCAENSQEVVKEALRGIDYSYVPYKKVGHQLSMEIKTRVRNVRDPGVILLENHGIIVDSNDPGKCLEKFRRADKAVRSFLEDNVDGYARFTYKGLESDNGYLYADGDAAKYVSNPSNTGKFLFPDAAVFLDGMLSSGTRLVSVEDKKLRYNMERKKALNINELLASHMYLIKNIEKFGRPRYLSAVDVKDLLGMESERHRMRIMDMGQ